VKHFWVIALHYGSQPRYDLGLIEMIFAIFMAIGFALTWRFGGAKGWYVVAASLLYAPVRFALDFLRETDPAMGDIRYWELTPAQWACFLLFAFGIGLGFHLYCQQVNFQRSVAISARG
jgi:phosphatidylglycerol:prolipoprotein diacylglycerol transferase